MAADITIQDVRARIPERPEDGHKGAFGHLFVITGSRGFTGAAKLTVEAAGRSGVGLVTAGVPQSLGDVVAAMLVEGMTYLLPATDAETLAEDALGPALEFASTKDAVAMGPGLSQHDETQQFVWEFVAQCEKPMAIDADGLNCLSREVDVLKERIAPTVVTPHPGEMARLAKVSTKDVQGDRAGMAQSFAKNYGCVVVLKGHRTVVASPDGEVLVNPTGNAGMATGGTGDVLTGFLGGLLAQGVPVFDAALVAVYLHGLAGDLAAAEATERGLMARDVIDGFTKAWRAIEAAD